MLKGKRKKVVVDLSRNYEDLANAIVEQAVADYRSLKGNSYITKLRKKSIEDFFHSELFGLTTSIDPNELINKLNNKNGKGEVLCH